MSRPAQHEEVWNLIVGCCDGTLDDGELQQLEQMLREDETARQLYFDYIDLTTDLRQQSVNAGQQRESRQPLADTDAQSETATPLRNRLLDRVRRASEAIYDVASNYIALSLVVSGLFFAILLLSMAQIVPDWKRFVPGNELETPSVEFVARITDASGATFDETSDGDLKNRDLFEDDTLVLNSGLIVVTYDTGARVVLEGPATYQIQGANGGNLVRGKLLARVDTKEALGFAVDIPGVRITDLGTEFGVDVRDRSAVYVLDGAVNVAPLTEDGTVLVDRQQTLTTGQSVSVHAGHVRFVSVDLATLRRRAVRFDLSQQVRPITGILATASSAEFAGRRATRLVDRSGLNGMKHTSNPTETMWNVARNDEAPYLVFDLGTVYRLGEAIVWNYNAAGGYHRTRFVQSMDVWISVSGLGTPQTNPDEWQRVHDDQSLLPATGRDDYDTPDRVSFADVPARYVRLDDMRHPTEAVDDIGIHFGLSEVVFWGRPAPPDN